MNGLYYLAPEAVALAAPVDKHSVIDELAGLFAGTYDLDRAVVRQQLEEREALGSTGFGRGAAIPHARLPGISRPVSAVLRLEAPVDFDAADGQPVQLAFGLLSPEQAGATHLHALAAISRLLREERVHEAIVAANEPEVIYSLLSNVSDRDAA